MPKPFLSFQGYTPSKISASEAIGLTPPFVQALEHIYAKVSATIQQINLDAKIYDRAVTDDQVNEHLYTVLQKYLNRSGDAQFWFRLEGSAEEFRLVPDLDLIEQLKSNLQWQIQSRFKSAECETKPLGKGIHHLGHAGAFINESARILIDPVFYPKQDNQVIETINMTSIVQADAIFFTHFHPDHFDLDTLMQIPRDTPVYIPKCVGRPFEPQMINVLHKMGFTSVHEASAGDRIAFPENTFIDLMPFFGEGRELVGFEAFCPLYSSLERRVLFHADSGPNFEGQSILDSEIFQANLASHGPIDTIFGTWWQGQDLLFRLSPFLLISDRFTSKDWLKTTENCNCSIEFIQKLISKSKAKKFVTYAERGAEIFKSLNEQSDYIQTVSLFWIPRETYKAEIEESTGAQFLEALPRQSY